MILPNLKGKKVILASQSPRRQELLKGIAIDFEVLLKENINEDFDPEIPIFKVAEYLALKKAKAYDDILESSTVLITADTIVTTDSEILNKPFNEEEARHMLNILSGKKHHVITGVCIKSLEKEICFSEESAVYFEKLESAEIEYYIKNFKPFDKAGAYGIQEWIGYIGIKRIEGSYFNVMGLPIHAVYRTLKKF
jgi:septum formation protein